MALTGELFIGGDRIGTKVRFAGVDPSTGADLPGAFSEAGAADVEAACAVAAAAFRTYRETTPDARADFLETIADNIEALGDALLERTERETGLPRARLIGERGRTTGQLRLFASVVRRGDWLGARLDPALPERQPAPRSDLRLRKIALGPVAVFGASNFPLAFSVAGGDTVSALAAGCPVIVKGHPAHPGAGELVAGAIAAAVESCGLPEGVFSMLSGTRHELGAALVADRRIRAVGFTGSRAGGQALMRIAHARPEPIPVYAEMSAINPVILGPAALTTRAESLGVEFAGSLGLGAGQFCTKPGLVLGIVGPALDRFTAATADAILKAAPGLMLTPGIYANFTRGVAALSGASGVETIVAGGGSDRANFGRGALFATTAAAFVADKALREEVFGASAVVVRCADETELAQVLEAIEGQLTATLQIDAADASLAARLLPVLEEKVGRILVNGWPTGVEVTHAMVHGGPFPATSDARSTSVGSLAIERFLRPVCYQNLPANLLPDALGDANPYRLIRLVDGVLTHP